MRTLRTVGAIGTVTALLLSAGVAFAATKPAVTAATAERTEVRNVRAVATTTLRSGNERKVASTSQERMKAKREEAQAKGTAKREKVAQRIKDIEDKAKKEAAQKIAEQFENLNKTWTDKFMNQLDKYDAIVQKMQARSSTAAAAGKDVTVANTAIGAAVTAIATAKEDVTAQAAKTYVLDTSTLPTTSTTTPAGQTKLVQELRKKFQTMHTALFKDLFALRDGPMKDARKALENALKALGKVPKVDDDKETATSTPNQ